MRAEAISTGLLSLDVATYVGGYPRGNVVELYGDEESGKTTLALLAIRETQRAGGLAALLDVDGTVNASYAVALGVDEAALLVAPARTAEQAFEVGARLLGTVDLLVMDAVATLIPAAEIEGRIGDAPPGAQRQLVEQGVGRLFEIAAARGALALCVNQIRHQRVGTRWVETTAGGTLLPHRAAMRVEARRRSQEAPVALSVVKNTFARVAVAGAVPVTWGQGFDAGADLLAAAERLGLVGERDDALWFEGRRLGTREEAVARLRGSQGQRVREAVLAGAPWRRAEAFAPL